MGGESSFWDISEEPAYANICGFTHDEFDRFIGGPLAAEFAEGRFRGTKFGSFADFKSALFEMYDGYSWNGLDRLLNPFSLLNALYHKNLRPYWFLSVSPRFLAPYVKADPVAALDLDNSTMTHDSLMNQSAGKKLDFVPLLYQTGCLTLKKPEEDSLFSLKIPNTEVREAWERIAAETLLDDTIEGGAERLGYSLKIALQYKNEQALEKGLSELARPLGGFPARLRERAFLLFVSACLESLGVVATKLEKASEGGAASGIFFVCAGKSENKREEFLLVVKQVECGPQQSAPTLEEAFAGGLEAAEAKRKKAFSRSFPNMRRMRRRGMPQPRVGTRASE